MSGPIDWDAMPFGRALRQGQTSQWAAGERCSVQRAVVSADAVFDGRVHRHEHEQWVVVIEGLLTLRLDEELHDLRPGDLVFIPGWQWHGAAGVGAEGAVYYEWFVPARFDGLPGSFVPTPLEWR